MYLLALLLSAHRWSDRVLICPAKMAFNSQGCTQILCLTSKPKTSPTPASSLGESGGQRDVAALKVQKLS